MRRTGYLGVSLILLLALTVPALPSFAQAQQPQLKTQPEYNGYVAIINEKDPVKKAVLAETFIKEFSTSEGVPIAHQMLITAFMGAKNWAKVMETADRIEKLPQADNKLKAYAYANAMIAAQNTNNIEKVVSYGEKVLAIDPNDPNALIAVSAAIPAKLPTDEAGKKAALDKATELSNRALTVVEGMMAKADPGLKGQLEQIQGNLHATLGLVAYNRADYNKSIQEYELALQKTPKDEVAHYYLALDHQTLAAQASREYQNAVKAENDAKASRAEQPVIDELVAKRTGLQEDVGKYRDKALDEFGLTVAIGGQLATQAKEQLTKLWTAKNDNTAGLEEFIAEKKKQLG